MTLISSWIGIINKIATGDWKQQLLWAPIAGALFAGSLFMFIVLALVTDTFFNFPVLFPSIIDSFTGAALLLFGFALMLYSMLYFFMARGTPVPLSPPPKLVTSGPYRFARNPMLTGIFIQLFALGLFRHSISLAFIFTPLFIAINYWELKYVEEPELEKRLGKEYLEYKKRVPMFFPWVKARR
jgi:protein-S-isoprenylcysteine O-methyltransferase Ste14